MVCKFEETLEELRKTLESVYEGDEFQREFEAAKRELISSNVKRVPVEYLFNDFVELSKSGEVNKRKLERMEKMAKESGIMTDELVEAKEQAWLEMQGRLGGRKKGMYTTARGRKNAGGLFGSEPGQSWADRPIQEGETVELKSLINDFKDQFSGLLEELLPDGDREYTQEELDAMDDTTYFNLDYAYVLKKNFDDTAQKFIDAGLEIDYEFVQRLNNEGEHKGSADLGRDAIHMSLGNNSEFMSKAEILLHEMQHLMVEKTLQSDYTLKNKIKRLRKTMLKDPSINYMMFLVDKPNPTQAQIDWAKKHFDYVFKNPNSPEGEFLVAATTNRYVIRAIANHAPSFELVSKFDIQKEINTNIANGRGNRRGETFSTKFKKVFNALTGVINQAYAVLIGAVDKDTKAAKTGYGLANEMLAELIKSSIATERGERDMTPPSNFIMRAWKKSENKLNELSERIEKSYEDIEKYGSRLRKKDGIAGFLDRVTNHGKLLKFKNDFIVNGWMNTLMRDTTDASTSWFYEMVRVSKYKMDKDVTETKTAVRRVLTDVSGWSDIPEDDGLRTAATEVLLRTDVKAMGGIYEVEKYLNDEKLLDTSIKSSKSVLHPEVAKAAYRLAYRMVHGIELAPNGFKNAHELVHVLSKKYKSDLNKSTLVEVVDTLASLEALKMTGKADKEIVMVALKDAKKQRMLRDVVEMYDTRNAQSLKSLYQGNPKNMTKGGFKPHFEDKNSVSLASEEDLTALAKLKIYPVAEGQFVPEIFAVTGRKYYMVSGPNLESDYTKGLLSTTELKSEGESFRGLLFKIGMTTSEVNEAVERISEMTPDESGSVTLPAMFADRNEYGKIEDYRIVPSHQQMRDKLGMKNDIVHVMANTVSNMTNKEASLVNNYKAVNAMLQFWDINKDDFRDEFIEVRPSSKEEIDAGKPYKYAYLWDVMPSYTQRYIDRKTGGSSLMVHKSMVQDFFGFKDASISGIDFLAKNHSTRFSSKVVEDVLKAFIARFKKVVVTLYPDTILGNLTSNSSVAMMQAEISPVEYAKQFKDVWNALDQFTANSEAIKIMDIERDMGREVDEALYASLIQENKENMVYDLVEDGQYTQILEDIDLSTYDSESYTQKRLRKLFDNLPGPIGDIKAQLYFDQGTTMNEKIMKLTQYGDIINRVIIYNARKDKENKKVLLNRLDQLYVNYSYLDNKWVKWANDTGVALFTKYTFRMVPVIWKVIKRNPLTVAFFQGTQKVTGFDVDDIFDSYYSPWDTLVNKFSWGDPGNLFQAVFEPIPVQAL